MNSMPQTNTVTAAADDIARAQKVLKTEIEALGALSDALDDSFTEAVSAIHDMKENSKGGMMGRLIITGMGKSGHIARKIAATMASTGTPSYFVHPGEASHGDLGMVTENDVVLMLSNSGENSESSDLIHYCKRFEIPLIAITSNKDSTLGSHSDICLTMPKRAEACPNGLAPTTSTTMMIALGDALAVALLERTGMTAEQFKTFHPGGKLGQKLLKVSDLMQPRDSLPIVKPDTLMSDAIITMTQINMGCVIALKDDESLAGIITDGDLKRNMGPDLLQKKVADLMTDSPKTIEPNVLGVEALNIMTKTPGQYITSLLVTGENGAIKGLIRLQDCLQAGLV